MPELPEPISRQDKLLHNIADGTPDIENLIPTSREEVYLKFIALNSGSSSVTYPITIENGGTGATDEEGARENIDVYSKGEVDEKITQSDTNINGIKDQLTETDGIVSELQNQLTETDGTVSDIQTQLTETSGTVSDLQGQLTQTDSKVSGVQTQLTQTNNKVSGIQTQLTQTDSKVSDLERQLEEITNKISGTVLYENASGTYETITLSDVFINYKRIKVCFMDNGVHNSVDMFTDDGSDQVELANIYLSRDNALIYVHSALLTFSGDTATFSRSGVSSLTENGSIGINPDLNGVRVTKIIGYTY